MGNIIAGGIIVLLIGLASYKIYRDKKMGKMCSGCSSCPTADSCKSKHD